MGWTHFDKISTANGFATGAKNSETLVVNSAGAVVSGVKHAMVITFGTASAAETLYSVAPVTGIVTSCYAVATVASTSATYTVATGSAGSNVATAAIICASAGLATAIALSATPGTSVTAGQGYKFSRGAQGTAGASTVVVVINQTA